MEKKSPISLPRIRFLTSWMIKKNVLDNCLVELIRASLEDGSPGLLLRECHALSAYRSGEPGRVRWWTGLENYILAMGIRGGKRFRATWERTYRGAGDLNITELNAFKERAAGTAFCHAGDASDRNI